MAPAYLICKASKAQHTAESAIGYVFNREQQPRGKFGGGKAFLPFSFDSLLQN
jgi:hypothetical protein